MLARNSRRFRLPMIAGAAVAMVVAVTPAVSAAASDPAAREQVTLALAPHDAAALHALAASRGIARAQRIARLAEVIPSTAARRDVVSAVERLGLEVERVSTWTVRASGPAATVQRLFGSSRHNRPTSHFAHNLPTLPAELRGLVTAAFGGDESRPGFASTAGHGAGGTWDGTDFKAQYAAANATGSGTQTIATVQLSDWHPADLSTYAAAVGSPAPVSYVGIKDSFDPPTYDANNSEEVDLDQEAIYSIYPRAHQRAYLSGNDLGGMYDNLAAIGNDASDPSHDYHIVAASISWGACEDPSPDAAPGYDALENVLQYVVASGVTVFASTGDDGAFCDSTTAGVSYPASSPEVIAVGGTQPTVSSATPPTAEQAWDGSGGGTSALFYRPSWQPGGGARRTVPDIASLAGAPGFAAYTSTDGGVAMGGTSLSSPTSAALLAFELGKRNYQWGLGEVHAGLYADPTNFADITTGTQQHGGSAGVGYDTVTGLGTPKWDSLVTDLGGDPHLSATKFYTNSLKPGVTVHKPGFQSYTGYRLAIDSPVSCGSFGLTATPPTFADFASLGAPAHYWDGFNDLTLVAVDPANHCHYAYGGVFIDTVRPKAHAKIGLKQATSGANVTATWSFSDAYPSSGRSNFTVTITNQSGRTVYSATTTATSRTFAATQGSTYTVKVVTRDRAGNVSTQTQASFTVPLDDTHFTHTSGWSRGANSSDYGGSELVSAKAGASAAYQATARRYVLWFVTGPSAGQANIYISGSMVGTVDLYAATTHRRVPITVYTSSTLAARTVKVKVTGTKNAHSHGYSVYLDALQPVR